MADLNELADRVEKASGPDRRLDAQIALACLPEYAGWIEHPAGNGNQWGEIAPSREAFDDWLIHDGSPCLVGSPPFTASIDAAMSLVPEGEGRWPQMIYRGPNPNNGDQAHRVEIWWQSRNPDKGHSKASFALALTAAALRALAAHPTSEEMS